MNNLKLTGQQNFMGKEIPVMLGGFGEGKKCISDKTVAEIHNQPMAEIRKTIGRNTRRFRENVDFIDLKQRACEIGTSDNERGNKITTLEFLLSLGYAKQSITQAEHIYILSERGYAKFIKIMDTDLAWEIHDKLIDEYFQMRGEKEAATDIKALDPKTQLMNLLVENITNQELEQKRQAEKMERLDSKIDSIREVVALRPNAWRTDSGNLINKIAYSLGGVEHIKAVREESYKALEERMHVALNIRLTNKKKTNSLNGMCKSKLDKLNHLDVIADDPKLIEGYISVVKDMAVKYNIVDMA